MLRRLRLIDDKELKNAQQQIRAQSQQIKMRQRKQNISFGGGACSFFKMTSPKSSQARFVGNNDISNLISSTQLVQRKSPDLVKSLRNAKVQTNESEILYNKKLTEDAMLSFTNLSQQQQQDDQLQALKSTSVQANNNNINSSLDMSNKGCNESTRQVKQQNLPGISVQEQSKGETSRCDDMLFGLTDPKLSSVHQDKKNNGITQPQSDSDSSPNKVVNQQDQDNSTTTQFRVIATPRGNRKTSNLNQNVSFAEEVNQNQKHTESAIKALREFRKEPTISLKQGSELRQIFSNAMLKYGKIIKSSQSSPRKKGFSLNLKSANGNIFPLSNNNPNNSSSYFREITPLSGATSRTTASPLKKNMKRKHLPQTSCYIMSHNKQNSVNRQKSARHHTDMMRRNKMKQLGYELTQSNQDEQMGRGGGFQDRRTILSQMLYQSPSGKLYHSADINNNNNNNNDGSPTHSIMGFGNVFNQKTNQNQNNSPSPLDIATNQFPPSTPGHLISFADLIKKDKMKNQDQAQNTINNNNIKPYQIEYFTTPSGVNFGISNHSKILSATTSLQALSATSDIIINPSSLRNTTYNNNFNNTRQNIKSSIQSNFIQSPTAMIFRSPRQTIVTKSGANLLQRIKRPSNLDLYQQKTKRKALFSRVREQKKDFNKNLNYQKSDDGFKKQLQYNRRMNLYQPVLFNNQEDNSLIDCDTKDIFIKGRKSFERKNNHFQKLAAQNFFKQRTQWKAAKVNNVEAKNVILSSSKGRFSSSSNDNRML